MTAVNKAITRAINDPIAGVVPELSSRPKSPFSLVSQVASLEVGQCCSQVDRLNPHLTLKQINNELTVMKDAFRNRLTGSVRVARSNTKGQYSIEIAPLVTTPGQMYLVAVITRIE